jgi:ribosomal protein L22
MREVAAAVQGTYIARYRFTQELNQSASGLKLTKAYTYLGNVAKHDECIPFRRFAGGVGRTAQAKQFKATQGTCCRYVGLFAEGLMYFITDRSLARKVCSLPPASPQER